MTTPFVAPALPTREQREPQTAPSLTLAPAPRQRHYLQPGELLVSRDPTTVTTILGSCVSVCLWDGRRRIGAINHYVLPREYGAIQQPSRCGPIAIRRLVERTLELGSARGDLQAKLFGGAWIMAAPQRADHIGALNVEVARAELRRLGIPIVAEDVGGGRGRRVVFQTDSGVVLVKKL